MARGFVYLVVVLDWFSRRALSWRVSITLSADFCVEALEEALARHGKPEIFNTDQGSQGGINRSSQRSSDGGCDGEAESWGGSIRKGPDEVSWAARCCEEGRQAAVLAG